MPAVTFAAVETVIVPIAVPPTYRLFSHRPPEKSW